MALTITLSNQTFLETAPIGTIVGTLDVEGARPNANISFSGGSELFDVTYNATLGRYVLVTKVEGSAFFDFETAGLKQFDVSLNVEDMRSSDITENVVFTISVTDNTAPTGLTLSKSSVLEHVANGTEVGAFVVTDPDSNESFTYNLVDDADGRFEIVDGKLVVKDGSLLDYMTASSHEVTVEVTDADDNTYTTTLTVNIGDAFDFVNGTSKNNKLYGGAGADMIKGFGGNDKLYGFGGDDMLIGGTGKDMLYGGAGKDTFVFDNLIKKGHFDQIKDFNSADDTIQISLSALKSFRVKVAKEEVYSSLEGTKAGKKKGFYSLDKVFDKGKLAKEFFSSGKAKDSYDFVTYDKKNGFVYLDLDGSGRGKGIAIAKLKPGTYVTADDFLFI